MKNLFTGLFKKNINFDDNILKKAGHLLSINVKELKKVIIRCNINKEDENIFFTHNNNTVSFNKKSSKITVSFDIKRTNYIKAEDNKVSIEGINYEKLNKKLSLIQNNKTILDFILLLDTIKYPDVIEVVINISNTFEIIKVNSKKLFISIFKMDNIDYDYNKLILEIDENGYYSSIELKKLNEKYKTSFDIKEMIDLIKILEY